MRAGGLRALFGGSSNSPAHTPPAGSATQSAAASPHREQDPASPPATTTRALDYGQGAGAASAAGSSGGGGTAKGPSSQHSQEKAVQTVAALVGAAAPDQARPGEALQEPAPKRPRLMSGMEAVWKVFDVSQPLPPAWNSPLPADLGF